MAGKVFFRVAPLIIMVFILPATVLGQDLTLIGAYDSLLNALTVTVEENYAYVGDYGMGMIILDITDPSVPTAIGRFNPWPAVYDIYVAGDTAFLSAGSSEPYIGVLYAVDISDKTRPESLGSFTFSFEALSTVVKDRIYAFVANGGQEIRIINVTRPDSMYLINTFVIPGAAMALVYNNFLYVASGNAGLLILDISDPNDINILGSCDTPGFAIDVSLGNLPRGYAYIADNAAGLQIIDIHNPRNPFIVGSYETPDAALSVASYGSYTYIADKDSGLIVIQTSTPGNPLFITSTETPGRAQGVTRRLYNTYIASGHSLEIYSFNTTLCDYIPGDPNGSGSPNGLDVTYAVAYFKGGPPPPYGCECSYHGWLMPAGDVNGNCVFNGLDITYLVKYCAGSGDILFCPDCPPINMR